jgi:GT2 family glycosyltransferase
VDTYSAAFRRDLFLAAGGFDQGFPTSNNEDTELSYRLCAQGHKLVFNPRAIVYHQHPASFGRYLRTKFWRGYWRMVVYRRYPGKALQDTYTPLVLKAQTALMALSLALLPLALAWPGLLTACAGLWSLILLSSLPASFKALRADPPVGLISPLVILARAGVFALGSLYGLARGLMR